MARENTKASNRASSVGSKGRKSKIRSLFAGLERNTSSLDKKKIGKTTHSRIVRRRARRVPLDWAKTLEGFVAGKSKIVRRYAKQNKVKLIDIPMSGMALVDFIGIPVVQKDGQVKIAEPKVRIGWGN